jgi:3-dehydroquinate dehydratase/shikimate dehydrogenase
MAGQLRRALRYTRTIELRLDWLRSDGEAGRFFAWLAGRRLRATLIATCRRRTAGGRFRGSIASQLLVLSRAIASGCAWCDLEYESASRCPKEILDTLLGPARRLISRHFFEGTPARLTAIRDAMVREGGDAFKIAAQCDSLADAVRVIGLARGRRRIIAVPMGEAASPARVLALRAGSELAYAPVENATAPGQATLEEMTQVYRADRVNARTRVYGVIGNPVGHSLSPQLHNAGFQARGINAVYLPFPVRDLRDFLAAVRPLGIAGFSVTLPHKQRILRHLDGCDPLAEAIGAVNTVVVRGGGRLYGYNTDYVGVLRALERRMPLAGSRVLIFAGGEAVARASLRREFFDAIVNATPVGMHPHAGASPLRREELNCRLVFDLIYRPRQTYLLQLARRRGIETVSGIEMFLAQGFAQWEIWTGERAPEPAMRRAVLAALGKEERGQRPK